MKKCLKIIFINFILIFFLLLVSDNILYYFHTKSNSDITYNIKNIPPFSYKTNNPFIFFIYLDNYFSGGDNGRLPVGLEYKTNPIIVFGDSYALGYRLKQNETFDFILSEKLKRPVYNRAFGGASFQSMYYQVSTPFSETFFNQVPKSNTVFYVMIECHYLRMTTFSNLNVFDDYINLNYRSKNGSLVADKYNNPFINFIKSSYTIRLLNLKFMNWYIKSPISAEKITNQTVLYFIETRKKLEEQWNNKIDFIVIIYDIENVPHKDLLKKKLEENNFKVIYTSDLTNEDLASDYYLYLDDWHPKKTAWQLLTPLIIKKVYGNF